jgi:hypothetical protein
MFHGHQHVYDTRTIRQTARGHTLIVNAYGYKLVELNL